MNKIFNFKSFEKSYLSKLKNKFDKKMIFYITISCIFVISIIVESLITSIAGVNKFIILIVTTLLYLIIFFIKCYRDSNLKFKEFFYYIFNNEEKYSNQKFLLDTLKEYKIKELYKLKQISEHYKYIYPEKNKKTLLEKVVNVVGGIIVAIISLISINENGSIVNIVEFQYKLSIILFLRLALFLVFYYFTFFGTIIKMIRYRCIEGEKFLKEIPILLDEIIINYNRYFHKR